MANFTLKNIGTVETSKKKIQCSFKISANEFFQKFGMEAQMLSGRSRSAIEESINNNDAVKVKDADEIDEFFAKVEKSIADAERKKATAPAPAPAAPPSSSPSSGSSSNSMEAEASKPAELEDVKGERVPIRIVEKIVAKYEFNYLAEKQEDA